MQLIYTKINIAKNIRQEMNRLSLSWLPTLSFLMPKKLRTVLLRTCYSSIEKEGSSRCGTTKDARAKDLLHRQWHQIQY